VDLWVQCFHASVEHLGEAGELGDLGVGDPFRFEQAGRAAVDTISTPISTSSRANSTSPVLSETEIKAR
jgi:hypothetical protein